MSREQCRDVVGRHVRLLRDISTRGGETFKAGRIMVCYGTYRGRFTLQ